MTIEYTVRPVVRYFVTRWEDGRSQGSAWNTGSSFMGVFDSVTQANHIAHALAAHEDGAVAKPLDAQPSGTGGVGDLETAAGNICASRMESVR